MKNIVILGATSHIAKNLIIRFPETDFNIYLFARNLENVKKFVKNNNIKKGFLYDNFNNFFKKKFDIIINCIGAGSISKLNGDFTTYFKLTERFDNLIIEYLEKINNRALYISFSSGAVYGNDFFEPVTEKTFFCIEPNKVKWSDIYSIVRLYSESKHRMYSHLNIIDLRLFSFFSRFIDLDDEYFMCSVIKALLKKETLKIDNTNIVRDYIHPEDLFNIILACIDKKGNFAIDISSASPINKFKILESFCKEFGLKYEIVKNFKSPSATGFKMNYFSTLKSSILPCYTKYSSIETLVSETKQLLEIKCKENRY